MFLTKTFVASDIKGARFGTNIESPFRVWVHFTAKHTIIFWTPNVRILLSWKQTNAFFICFLLWRYPRCPPLCGRRFSVGWSWNHQRWYYRYVAVGPFNEFKQKRPLEKCLAKKEHAMTLWLNPKMPKAGSGLSYIDWIGYLLFIELPWLYPEGS